MMRAWVLLCALGCAAAACGGGGGNDDDDDGTGADAAVPAPDGGPAGVSLERCDYRALPPTAGAGGQVTAGPLMAGAAEDVLHAPVGTALGAYTARAGFLGSANRVDTRDVPLSGAFLPSIGIESTPRVKALALSAGGETVILIKADLGFPYEGQVFDLEDRLGPELAGKVILTVSHSHSSWGQFSGHSGIGNVGHGQRRTLVVDRLLDDFERVARAALADRRPARIGIYHDPGFDPDDQISHDRRGENDVLSGGSFKDDHLYMIRVDTTEGEPIAALPVFGMHGTIMGESNSLASTDAPGAVERLFEETFSTPVVVMHLQGAGADVSPTSHGSLDCDRKPGDDGDPCFDWLRSEGNGRAAAAVLHAAWEQAGADMQSELAIEMLTRSVELGPRPETFTVRGGQLAYAPFDRVRPADRVVFAGDGSVVSPIDEFNAPVGAALCESVSPIFPAGALTNTEDLVPYGSCVSIDVAGEVLGSLLSVPFESDETHPICGSTRTTVSALRLGDWLIGTFPGEPSTLIGNALRARSPAGADHTIMLGYSQGEVGYILTAEDWLQGGYESSINFWGPLEGEYLLERVLEVMALAVTPEREDAGTDSAPRYVERPVVDGLTIDDPAPGRGTIPESIPGDVWFRALPPPSAQPPAEVQRVDGLARFVWIGEDPQVSTPVVTLEQELEPGGGDYVPARRGSGRVVNDTDVLLYYTPIPLRRDGDNPQTYYWVTEWQPVSWIGFPGAASLPERLGLPLGRYRFHVVSAAYELTSEPFTVTAATLGVAAARDGSLVRATVTVDAPRGYRLLDMDRPSNRPVPLAGATFSGMLVRGGDVDGIPFANVVADANGAIAVDAGDLVLQVASIQLTDAYGNTGTDTLP